MGTYKLPELDPDPVEKTYGSGSSTAMRRHPNPDCYHCSSRALDAFIFVHFAFNELLKLQFPLNFGRSSIFFSIHLFFFSPLSIFPPPLPPNHIDVCSGKGGGGVFSIMCTADLISTTIPVPYKASTKVIVQCIIKLNFLATVSSLFQYLRCWR